MLVAFSHVTIVHAPLSIRSWRWESRVGGGGALVTYPRRRERGKYMVAWGGGHESTLSYRRSLFYPKHCPICYSSLLSCKGSVSVFDFDVLPLQHFPHTKVPTMFPSSKNDTGAVLEGVKLCSCAYQVPGTHWVCFAFFFFFVRDTAC